MENKTKDFRIFYAVISILVALVIWIFVDGTLGTKVPVTLTDIPVSFFGEDTTLASRGLMLLDDTETKTTLELIGTRYTVAQLDPHKIRVLADLSGITTTGKQNVSYRIVYPSGVSSSSVTVTSANSILVDVGEFYQKEVEIECDVQGAVAEGYIAGQLELQPTTLQLRGQKSTVDKVDHAEVTLSIDNAKETTVEMLPYTLYDSDGKTIEPDGIHFTTDSIKVTLPVNVVKNLPLTMDFVESSGSRVSNINYSIDPLSVNVLGDAVLLKNVSSIVLDTLDLSELRDPTTFNYEIPLPEGCKTVSGIDRATMKISFRDMTYKNVTANQFECINLAEGKTVTVLTNQMTVRLRGTSSDLKAVTPDLVTITANLNGISAASGSYTVPAAVNIDTDGDVGIIGNYQIRIKIAESEPEHSEDQDVLEEPEESNSGTPSESNSASAELDIP